MVLLGSLFVTNLLGQSRDQINIDVVEFDLENGLHVILHRDASMPIVTIDVWYHVGSKNEREGRTGFAHLFEHMMFQGSGNIPENGHFKHVQQAGGTLNGSTTVDRTNYYETLPSNQLELGLWLESDRMKSLTITQRNLDNQREVVKEERRTRYDNVPYGTMSEALFSHAYKVQSYKWTTIGSMVDLNRASLEDVRQFHAMYYVPNNASLCIAGDIDYEQTKKLVRKYFSDISRGTEEIFRPTTTEPPQTAQVRDTIFDNVRLPALMMGFHIPDRNHPDFAALDLLASILSDGRSSRLYQRLVYKERLAQSVSSSANGMEMPGLFIFRSTAQMGKNILDVERVLWEEIKIIQDESVRERELEKAKNNQEASFINRLRSVFSKADLLNSYHVFQKNARNINTDLARSLTVSGQDVQRVARKYFGAEHATVIHCLPKGKTTTTKTNERE